MAKTYSVEVVLLVNLPLNGTVNTKLNQEGVAFGCVVVVGVVQGISKSNDSLACALLLLIHCILEVTIQALNLFDLLGQITAQSTERADHVSLNILGLVGLGQRVLVVVGENATCVCQATVGDEDAGVLHVLDDIGDLYQSLATLIV